MLKCGGKICYIHIVVVIVVDRIFGQFTMETILATAFGRQVNVLKGEGDELTEIAAAMFSDASINFMIWVESIRCMYNYCCIIQQYTFSAQLPVLNTISGLMASYLKLTADFQKIGDTCSQLVQARRQANSSEVTLVRCKYFILYSIEISFNY